MAVTSIWAVGGSGSLGKVIRYAENPEKTDNPAFPENREKSDGEEWLANVIGYAAQAAKTTGIAVHDEGEEIMRRFVTGVNCGVETAREEMTAVKARFGKTGGVAAYHGYQSFAPGEGTPERAHEIGVKLAERLWGERFQVIVATHLDKANHLHNHFVLNTVSMTDGKRYHRTERDYHLMKKESDALCLEYKLSVIEEPKRGKTRQYGEHLAEREGKPTWRGLVKDDVDAAVRASVTERQFFENLKKRGYEIKIGNRGPCGIADSVGWKDISIRPQGKERFVRLERNYGEDYGFEGIRKRILAQTRPERPAIPTEPPRKKTARLKGSFHRQPKRKLTGYRARYYYYLYRMGAFPKSRQKPDRQSPKKVYFLFREDIRHMQNIAREIRLLAAHGIDSREQLEERKMSLSAKIGEAYDKRKHLRHKARNQGGEELAETKAEIAALTDELKELRREVRLCEDIERRSTEMEEKLRRAREDEKTRKTEDERKMTNKERSQNTKGGNIV
jgi:hypothetical protein